VTRSADRDGPITGRVERPEDDGFALRAATISAVDVSETVAFRFRSRAVSVRRTLSSIFLGGVNQIDNFCYIRELIIRDINYAYACDDSPLGRPLQAYDCN